MKKIVLTFGLLSGVVVGRHDGRDDAVRRSASASTAMLVVGYTVIVISFLFVYFGIRSYRDNVLGGQITFGKGFQAGILITLISCVFYVGGVAGDRITHFMPDFADKYAAYLVEDQRASGGEPGRDRRDDQAGRGHARRWLAQPVHQRRRDLHRAVSGRPAHHADLRGGSCKKAAT